MTEWLFYALGAALALYALIVLAFVVGGRREDARALAGFVPDCVVLFARLVRDDRLARRHKILVAGLIPYLALPIDLIPDFIPVAGELDDAVWSRSCCGASCERTRVSSKSTGLGRDRRLRFCCDSSAPRIGSLPRDGQLRVGQRILIVTLFSMTVAESPVTRIVMR